MTVTVHICTVPPEFRDHEEPLLSYQMTTWTVFEQRRHDLELDLEREWELFCEVPEIEEPEVIPPDVVVAMDWDAYRMPTGSRPRGSGCASGTGTIDAG